MTNWNHDISAAPRGRYETRTRTVGDRTQEYTVFISERVLIVDETGKVFGTAWVEPGKFSKNGRWGGWCEGQEPIAWAPWPTYELGMERSTESSFETGSEEADNARKAVPETEDGSVTHAGAGESPATQFILEDAGSGA